MAGRPLRRARGGPHPPSTTVSAGDRTPFAKGNSMSVKGGGRSPRVYGALASQLTAGLLEDRPDLAAYPEAVAAWATAEAKAALFRRHLEEVGILNDDGEPRTSALHYANVAENGAAKHRAVLGLDPHSEASLARERASATALGVDLAVLAERGRAVLDAREAAGIAPPPDVAGEVLQQIQSAGDAVMSAAAERAGLPAPRSRTTDTDIADTTDTTIEETTR